MLTEIAAVAALPLIGDTPDNASINYIAGDKSMNWPMGSSYMGLTDNFLLSRPSKTLIDSLKVLNDERLKVWVAPLEKPWTNVKADNGKVETTVQKGYTYTSTWEYMIELMRKSNLPQN